MGKRGARRNPSAAALGLDPQRLRGSSGSLQQRTVGSAHQNKPFCIGYCGESADVKTLFSSVTLGYYCTSKAEAFFLAQNYSWLRTERLPGLFWNSRCLITDAMDTEMNFSVWPAGKH